MSVQEIRKWVNLAMNMREHFMCHWEGVEYPKAPAARVEWVNSTFRLWELYWDMAKKTANAAPAVKQTKVDFKGFCNYVLTDADKEKYKVWDVDDHDLWDVLATCLQSGYKISTSYNAQNDTYSATLMCNDAQSVNAGYCLSAFAPDVYHALRTLIFKHTEVLEFDWQSATVKEQDKWG